MEKVRYGIIGLGNQGSSYVFNIFEKGLAKDAQLVALCDNNPAKIEYMKEKTQNESYTYFDNYIDMLDSGLCDAVLVEVPHYDHPQMVIDCLRRGIHVICEKPAGVYTKHVREMNEVAKECGARFGMMFNQRTNCVYRKMREMIKEGAIGELQRVTWIITDWFRTQQYYDGGAWRATWAGEGGGVLINQCPHQLDLVQWVVGKLPSKVNAFCEYGKWHDIEV
ncbi:MAG: Gfo/Idh/MocA family oxidoreductase, partial [Clostridia bacterium]|nr:Gfo/Idh/MocA family oxidoreductase [Clostridia bacterium]